MTKTGLCGFPGRCSFSFLEVITVQYTHEALVDNSFDKKMMSVKFIMKMQGGFAYLLPNGMISYDKFHQEYFINTYLSNNRGDC